MNGEPVDDAALDAFLNGEDDLSASLQAMGQAAPSAELDAAIMAQAAALMADEQGRDAARLARPAAANDPLPSTTSSWPPAQLGLRWRVPAGIAAVLIAGVLARQSWESSTEIDRVVREPAREAASDMSAPPPPQQPLQEAAQPKIALPPAKAESRPRRAAPKAPAAQASAPAPVMEDAAPPLPPPPPPALSYSAGAARAPARVLPPAPAPEPITVAAGVAAPKQEASRAVQVVARRSRIDVQTPAPAPTANAAAAASQDPAAWLAAIDELLRAGLRRDSIEEWDKFRAAYPDYPVPAATAEKIDALKKP